MKEFTGWEVPTKTVFVDIRGGSHDVLDEAMRVNNIALNKFVEGYVEEALQSYLKTQLGNEPLCFTYKNLAPNIYKAYKEKDFSITAARMVMWEQEARKAFKEKYNL